MKIPLSFCAHSVALLWAAFLTLPATALAQTVTFPDPHLEAAVRDALAKPAGDITAGDMLTLTQFYANNRDISDTTGLGAAHNLNILECSGNPVTNFTGFAGLTNLQRLTWVSSSLSDLAFTTNFPALRTMFLYANQLTDVSPLVALTNLESLQLDWNPGITNLPLLTSLTNLLELNMAGDNLTEVYFVTNLTRLQWLGLYGDYVNDISPVVGLSNLLTVGFSWNGVTNAPLLAHLPQLKELWLGGNHLTNISFLAGLTNLTLLRLEYTDLIDMSPVTNMTRLAELNVGENQLTQLPDLSALTNLIVFMTAGNQLTDLSPLTGLSNVRNLHLQRNRFHDLSPVTNCVLLDTLLLSGNTITNLSTIGALSNLWNLELRTMALTNLDFVVPLQQLHWLDATENRLTDLAPLTNLPALDSLGVEANHLQAIGPLLAMPSLHNVIVKHNYLVTNDTSAAWSVITNFLGLGHNIEFDPQYPPRVPIQILAQPANRSAFAATTVTFRTTVIGGAPAANFQWQRNGVDLANDWRIHGADSDTLQIEIVDPADAGLYHLRIWDDWMATNSATVELRVITNVAFADPNLELAVRDQLGIPVAPLTPDDLVGLTGLDASHRSLTNLSGLEAAADLVGLNLVGNTNLTAFSPLSYLGALNAVDVGACGLTDLAWVADLRTLTSLQCGDNFITDLAPVHALTNLVELSAHDNYLVSLEPLLGLDALDFLNVTRNYLDTNATTLVWSLLTNLVAQGATVEYDPQHAAPVHPHIVTQPLKRSTFPGSNVTFQVVVTGGTPQASFRWQKDGVDLADGGNISGATTDTLHVGSVTPGDAAHYRVRVWDPWVLTNSAAAELLVITNIAFTDPNLELAVRDRLGIPSNPLTLANLASLTDLDADWRGITNLAGLEACINIAGLNLANNPSIADFAPVTFLPALRSIALNDCELTDLGWLAQLPALIHLEANHNLVSDLAPLQSLPGLQYVSVNQNQLTGMAVLTNLLELDEVHVALNHLNTNDAAIVAVVNTLVSRAVLLEIDPQYFPPATPVILAQPVRVAAFPNDDIHFTVAASGAGPLHYRWQKDGVNLFDGARVHDSASASLTIDDALAGDAGNYRVLIWDEFGVTNSQPATLRVVTNVAFADPQLERAVRDRLGIPAAPLSPASLVPMDWLDAHNYGITNLSGLESAANLNWLSLRGNREIADFTPLTSLWRLTYLELNDCGVTNIDFVAALPPLEELHLWRGHLTDISPLLAQPQLMRLNLAYHTGITNLEILNTLTNLEGLALEGTGLTNIAFAALMPRLRDFSFEADAVHDLSPLAGATNLANLDTANNGYTNATPLATCTNLEWLSAGNNQINDLSFTTNLHRLWFFSVDRNPFTDLAPVAGLTNLRALQISESAATNTEVIANLARLTDLHISRLGLSNNLGFLSALTNLQVLGASWNSISDLPSYPSLSRLRYLNLEFNPLTNLSFVAGLTNLQELIITGTGMSDLSPLAGCTNLLNLALAGDGITNLSSLATLPFLEWISLWDNQVQDISALAGLTNLHYVDLRFNWLNIAPDSATMTIITNLQARGVTVDYNPQNSTPVELQIVLQPTHRSAFPGSNVTFHVVVTGGTPAALFRWQKDGVDLADDGRIHGADSSTLQIDNVSPADAAQYRVRVWDPWTTTNSLAAELLVITNIAFTDPNLELAVRARLGIPSAPLTLTDLASLTDLDADWRGITNLSGIEAGINLTGLNLAGNRAIANFMPVTFLPALRSLALNECELTDLSWLAWTPALTHLGVNNNLLQDLAPLQNLTGLQYLWANENHFTGIGVLTNLLELEEVHVARNHLNTNAAAIVAVVNTLVSRAVLLEIDPQYFPPATPLILAQPVRVAAFPGDDVRFNVSASGAGTLHYRWQRDGLNLVDNGHIFDSANDQLTVAAVQGADAGNYRVLVWDEFGVTNSQSATLRVVTNVAFADPQLESAVRDRLGIPAAPLSPASLAPMDWLEAHDYGITNLSGLEAAANLAWLSLRGNQGLTDFTPLTALWRLTYLELNDCGVTNIDFVAALPPLNELHLWRGNITDISPLLAQPQLMRLNLAYHTGITNLEILNTLTNLEGLALEGTGLTNVAFAALMPRLRDFSFEADAVHDLSPLAGATNLANLDTANNGYTNATPLATCTNLEWLSAGNNQINDLGFVANLHQLWFLAVNGNPFSDVSPLAGLTNLQALDVGWSRATNLAPVGSLTALTNLNVGNLGLSNLTFLAPLTNLTGLSANDNLISELPPYPHLSRLYYLNLEHNPLANINFVSGMTNLTDCNLNGTGARNLSPLTGRENLTSLGLAGNALADVAPLATLPFLRWVTLWDNHLQDISALASLTNLTYVDLRHNWLNVSPGSATMSIITNLQARGVTVDYDPQGVAPSAVTLSNPIWLGAHQFQFTINSAPGAELEVWSSPNLTTWTYLGRVTNTTGATNFTDTAASELTTFYRARTP